MSTYQRLHFKLNSKLEKLAPLDEQQHEYVVTIEEVNELMQALTSLNHNLIKGLRFGLDDKGPGRPLINREIISKEANDVIAMLMRLDNLGFIEITNEEVITKLAKVQQFMDYAINNKSLIRNL